MINTRTAQKIRSSSAQSKTLQLTILGNSQKSFYEPGDRIEGLVTVEAPNAADVDVTNLSVRLTGTSVTADPKSSAKVADCFLSHREVFPDSRLPRNKLVQRSTKLDLIFSFELPHSPNLASTSMSSDSRVAYTVSAELGLSTSTKKIFGTLNNPSWRLGISGGRGKSTSPMRTSEDIVVVVNPLGSYDDCLTLCDNSVEYGNLNQNVAA
ncbi:hypothetical protein NADFUDRAFT_84274 [Nadsonia fulvescens var. elongata DSM 6958]|uniref:Arrestin-like N-terminal domain-containing protein n=1 Tax=Nadsonia fulvescens var. elongata DSM 6958 TaxID=857566 RepID=A0A1E3PFJ0_9ASCO|nr:hypothetical protein NADFUDRAFT_84274 [Nadsonia fulvescens var. elongata DSM 6958]